MQNIVVEEEDASSLKLAEFADSALPHFDRLGNAHTILYLHMHIYSQYSDLFICISPGSILCCWDLFRALCVACC